MSPGEETYFALKGGTNIFAWEGANIYVGDGGDDIDEEDIKQTLLGSKHTGSLQEQEFEGP